MEKKSEYKGKLCSSSKKKKTRVCRHMIAMNNPFPPRPILPVNKTCTEWNCCTVTMNVLFLTPVSSSIVSFLFLFHSMFVLCYCYYCCCSFLRINFNVFTTYILLFFIFFVLIITEACSRQYFLSLYNGRLNAKRWIIVRSSLLLFSMYVFSYVSIRPSV